MKINKPIPRRIAERDTFIEKQLKIKYIYYEIHGKSYKIKK